MLNGHPEFGPGFTEADYRAIRSFFAGIAPALEAFADKHNLKIDKYYHESPTWTLMFRHPQKGIAMIEVERLSGCSLRLRAVWWHDDYDAATRSVKQRQAA
jgi:hypothetical protein